jgi:hypothetical protein
VARKAEEELAARKAAEEVLVARKAEEEKELEAQELAAEAVAAKQPATKKLAARKASEELAAQKTATETRRLVCWVDGEYYAVKEIVGRKFLQKLKVWIVYEVKWEDGGKGTGC